MRAALGYGADTRNTQGCVRRHTRVEAYEARQRPSISLRSKPPVSALT